jgi:hypothetical protein
VATKIRSRQRDVMIIDYNKCMRVPVEDAILARPSIPHRCPACAKLMRSLTPQSNSARLKFDGEPTPQCEDHETPVTMVPVSA